MMFDGEVLRLFPVVKIITTTIPLTFFDFFTDAFAVSVYAKSPSWAVKAIAILLGRFFRHFSSCQINIMDHESD